MNLVKPGFTYDVLTRSKGDGGLVDALRSVHNRVPREGLNAMATAAIKNGTGPAAFFIGLWSGSHIPNGEETATTLGSLVTEVTSYGQTGRLPLVLGSVADGAASNTASLARFDMLGSGTINGAFVSTVQTKSASTGTLFSVVRFPSPRAFDASLYLELLVGFQFTSLSL
jgi:hypothetical protein